jgi:hypothetical protein
MIKLLRAMPELMVLVKGMIGAFRSVLFTLALLFIIIYVFAILFTQAMQGTDIGARYFPSVLTSVDSLLLHGVLPDQASIISDVGQEHPILRFCILMYILLASLTVMNMLIGVLCEVVSVVAAVEKEELNVMYVKTQLHSMLEKQGLIPDDNQEMKLGMDDFERLLEVPEACRILHEVGVDVFGLHAFSEFLFKDETYSFPEFMDLVLQLRGSNTSTVKDMVDMRKLILGSMGSLEGQISNLEKKIEEMQDLGDHNLEVSHDHKSVRYLRDQLNDGRQDGGSKEAPAKVKASGGIGAVLGSRSVK